jgi:argininosuccinate lyase
MDNKKKNKLWQKEVALADKIESFTVGKDRQLDLILAEYDVLGSIAHIIMLESVGLLTKKELQQLKRELILIYQDIKKDRFKIGEGIEDIHSQIELILTERLGAVGKKIHSGRSRNDQVLLDIRLYIRHEIEAIVKQVRNFFDLLIESSEKYKHVEMPGYTHTQVAMPSSFGLWFASFAEALVDDLIQLSAAYKIINKNPLGSAAGYGSSFPLNRQMTTDLLGFEVMNINSIYAQAGRGRSERIAVQALVSLAETCARLATDVILFMSQNFNFVSFPDALTTGSSIMPHKKNPDVFELVRARCNRIKVLPNEIMMITANLISGYHRDLQLIKETLVPAFADLKDCLDILQFILPFISIREDILSDNMYRSVFSVEAVNKLVAAGIPFREAYQRVAGDLEKGKFERPTGIRYTHEGSTGNLANKKIIEEMFNTIRQFNFQKVQNALSGLLKA